jgi:hypothetical protein
MQTDVRRLFPALVLEGALLTVGLAGCGPDSTPRDPAPGEQADEDDSLEVGERDGPDKNNEDDTDTDTDASGNNDSCPDTCIAADHSLSGSGDWATCYPASDVCCWVTNECCDVCCE